MSVEATICGNCGAKVRASHARCPRCRAVLTSPAATGNTPAESRAMPVALIVLGLVAAITAYTWWGRGHAAAPAAPVVSTRTLPQPAAAVSTPAADADAPVPPIPSVRPSPRVPPDPEGTDPSLALAAHREVLAQDPQNGAALYGVGASLLSLGRSHEALGSLRQAVQLNSGDWATVFTYGRAAAAAGEWPAAASAFRTAKGLASDAATHHNLGVALQRMGDYAGAAEEFGAAIALEPSDPAGHLGLGVSHDRMGRAADAVAEYREHLRLTSPGPAADIVRVRLRRLTGGNDAG